MRSRRAASPTGGNKQTPGPRLGAHGSTNGRRARAPRGGRRHRAAVSARGTAACAGLPGAGARRRAGAGGLGGAASSPPAPYLPPQPRSRPRRVSPPGQAWTQAVAASGKQSSEAGQLHHTRRLRNPRRPGSRRSGDRRPRRRRAQAAPAAPRSRPIPRPPGWLAFSSASPLGCRDPPSARGSRDARPVRATGRRGNGALGGGTSRGPRAAEGAGSDGLRAARPLRRLPRPPAPPHPLPLGRLAAFSHTPPAPVDAPLKAWRSESNAQCKPEGRKGNRWMDGWMDRRTDG